MNNRLRSRQILKILLGNYAHGIDQKQIAYMTARDRDIVRLVVSCLFNQMLILPDELNMLEEILVNPSYQTDIVTNIMRRP